MVVLPTNLTETALREALQPYAGYKVRQGGGGGAVPTPRSTCVWIIVVCWGSAALRGVQGAWKSYAVRCTTAWQPYCTSTIRKNGRPVAVAVVVRRARTA